MVRLSPETTVSKEWKERLHCKCLMPILEPLLRMRKPSDSSSDEQWQAWALWMWEQIPAILALEQMRRNSGHRQRVEAATHHSFSGMPQIICRACTRADSCLDR